MLGYFTISLFTVDGGSTRGQHREFGIRYFTELFCVFRNGVNPVAVCLDEVRERATHNYTSSLSRARLKGSYESVCYFVNDLLVCMGLCAQRLCMGCVCICGGLVKQKG